MGYEEEEVEEDSQLILSKVICLTICVLFLNCKLPNTQTVCSGTHCCNPMHPASSGRIQGGHRGRGHKEEYEEDYQLIL